MIFFKVWSLWYVHKDFSAKQRDRFVSLVLITSIFITVVSVCNLAPRETANSKITSEGDF